MSRPLKSRWSQRLYRRDCDCHCRIIHMHTWMDDFVEATLPLLWYLLYLYAKSIMHATMIHVDGRLWW